MKTYTKAPFDGHRDARVLEKAHALISRFVAPFDHSGVGLLEVGLVHVDVISIES